MPRSFIPDAHAPSNIAGRMQIADAHRAKLSSRQVFVLAAPACVFSGSCPVAGVTVMPGPDRGVAPGRLSGGAVFPLGPVPAIMDGAVALTACFGPGGAVDGATVRTAITMDAAAHGPAPTGPEPTLAAAARGQA